MYRKRVLTSHYLVIKMMGEQLSPLSSGLWIDESVSPDDDAAVFAKSVVDVDRMARSASAALGILAHETPRDGALRKWEVALDPRDCVYLRLVFAFEVPFQKTDVDAAVRLLRTQPLPNAHGFDPRVSLFLGPLLLGREGRLTCGGLTRSCSVLVARQTWS